MKKHLITAAILAASLTAQAQYSGPRLFLDVPVIYFAAPDVENIGNNLGAGAEVAMNVATHWSTVRVGGGAMFTVDPGADDVGDSFLTTPYGILEAGAGLYRSNGNKCAKTHANAFTAMAKAGLFYNFNTKETEPGGEKPDGLDYTVGAEFGYFFIRDVFRNFEIFLDGRYHTKAEVVSGRFGFKMFLNLKANR
ncbi:MAG: hypothetical protein DYG98_19630 [Haliscomenobacteraceae bacterium CHB4]|nr:hypothetical protein [Saprospiraceae bacterium]MCE7925273.1 hypothetical protein [Haliscomenobacteraceae bacterium CHB4]